MNGKVNMPIQQVCTEQLVRLAMNQWPGMMEVDFEEYRFVEYEIDFDYLWDWEIVSTFMESYDLKPKFLDCNYTWGWYDEEIGGWTGAIARVCKKLVCNSDPFNLTSACE